MKYSNVNFAEVNWKTEFLKKDVGDVCNSVRSSTEDLELDYGLESADVDDGETHTRRSSRSDHNPDTEAVLEDNEETGAKSKSTNAQAKRTRNSTAPGDAPATFTCDQCGHLCGSRSLLASHRHRKHRLKKSAFHCDKCSKQFDTHKKLEQHKKRPTCNVYPEFVCEYCSKKCIGLSNYNIHLRFHKKQYPYVCHLCAKSFMLASHLNCHVKTKHENQRYICEKPGCGKMFQTSHSLKMHAYVHAETMPYKCEYCTRMYPTKGRLRWHITRSHGIKHTLEDLDRMLVAKKISIKAEMKTAFSYVADKVTLLEM